MDSTAEGLSARPAQLTGLHVAETAEDLEALGFAPHRTIGRTRLIPGAADARLRAEIDGVHELDGLELVAAAEPGESAADGEPHPNGVIAIDHVVVMTPNPDRTQAAFEGNGVEARRVRRFETDDGARRQTFFWLGDVICEVAGRDDGVGDKPARWWGLALTVDDIDATAEFFGEECTRVKDAVQPGRRVTTLKSPRSRTPILFISRHPK